MRPTGAIINGLRRKIARLRVREIQLMRDAWFVSDPQRLHEIAREVLDVQRELDSSRRSLEGLSKVPSGNLRGLVILAVLLGAAGCGRPLTTCTLTYGADQYLSGPRCPQNTILVGTSGTQLICAAVAAQCPLEGAK